MTNDDYLTQVQKTENQAKDIVEKARQKASNDLELENRRRTEALKETLKKERNIERNKLKATQNNERNLYEEKIMQGKQDAKKLKNDMSNKNKKAIPAAEFYFVNNIL